MEIRSHPSRTLVFAIGACLLLLTVGPALANDGSELSVDGEISVPTQVEDVPGIVDDIKINSVATIEENEQLEIEAERDSTASDWQVQLRDGQDPDIEYAFEDLGDDLSGTASIDTTGLEPGSYILVTVDNDGYQSGVPIVVEGYDLTVSHSTDATVGDEITVTVDATDEHNDASLDSIEVTAHDGETDDPDEVIRETATETDDGTYEATLSFDDANPGSYDIYALATEEDRDGDHPVILGVGEGDAVDVEPPVYDVTVVVEDKDREPIADASVEIGGESETTSEDGETIFGLEPDSYTAEISADGYESTSESIAVDGDTTVTTSLEAESDDENGGGGGGPGRAPPGDSNGDDEDDEDTDSEQDAYEPVDEESAVSTIEETVLSEIVLNTSYIDLETLDPVSVEEQNEGPDGEPLPPRTFQAFTITVPDAVSDRGGTIRADVDTADLETDNLSADALSFERADGDEWERLDTTIAEESDETVTLEAETPSFSMFSITAIVEPTAHIDGLPDSHHADEELTLDASNSTDRYGEITHVRWEITNQATDELVEQTDGKQLSKSFAAGTYDVSLTVTNDAGEAATAVDELVVEEPEYTVSVAVENEGGEPLEDAMVEFDGDEFHTNATGVITTEQPPGSYTIAVLADGYAEVTDTVEISDETVQTITLEEDTDGDDGDSGADDSDASGPGFGIETAFGIFALLAVVIAIRRSSSY